jgi:LemA protein
VVTVGLLIVIATAFLWIVTGYNRLVDLRAQTQMAWQEVDAQLARRHELASRLARGMKGAVDNEEERMDAVLVARDKAVVARDAARPSGGITTLANAEAMVTSALSRLRVVAEQYPDVKSKGATGQMLEELRTIEERLSRVREHYSDAATAYNAAQRQFPERLMTRWARCEVVEPWKTTGPAELEVTENASNHSGTPARPPRANG